MSRAIISRVAAGATASDAAAAAAGAGAEAEDGAEAAAAGATAKKDLMSRLGGDFSERARFASRSPPASLSGLRSPPASLSGFRGGGAGLGSDDRSAVVAAASASGGSARTVPHAAQHKCSQFSLISVHAAQGHPAGGIFGE